MTEATTAGGSGWGRAGTDAEIAQAVLLLVGNGYMTGQTVAVNGGALFS